MQNSEEFNISKARYFLDVAGEEVDGIMATIAGVELSVPIDSHNRHYAEILRQVQSGLVIEEADNENE